MKLATTLLFAAAVAALFLVTDRLPQDPAYHNFADARILLGVPNALNVLTNLPFVVLGAWGLLFVSTSDVSGHLYPAWFALFAGILLTGLGSAWYHISPDNGSLFWDRLAMTVAFMAMLSILVGEYFGTEPARRVLAPLLVAGAASVVWWAWTESRGAGDLRPYAIGALLPVPLLPALLLWKGRGHGLTRPLWLLFASYLVAKVCEHFDGEIYAFGHLVSGHSLKHLAAAMVPAVLLHVLWKRHRSAAAPDDLVHRLES